MTTRTESGTLAGGRMNTLAAYIFGVVFVLVGLAGFAVSGGHHAVGQDGGALLGLFQVNVLHNVVHLAIGAVMIAAGIMGNRAAKAVNSLVGVVYLLLFVIGLFIVGTAVNIVALNGADNLLHLVLGLVLAAVGFGTDRA